MNEVDELILEHFGTKGMKWGVRQSKAASVKIEKSAKSSSDKIKNAVRDHPVAAKRIATGAIFATALLGAAAAGRAAGRHNMININTAKQLANEKAARVLINEGHRFTKSRMDSDLLFNAARHVEKGLRWDY